jgi:transcriptional regulator with XRE-family HTH domain
MSKMMYWERFEKLLNEKGVTIATMSEKLKIPYTTLDSIIKKHINNPKLDYTIAIAKYFGVTIEYMVTGKEFNKTVNKITHQEQELLDVFKKLSNEDKLELTIRAKIMVENIDIKKNNESTDIV